MSRLDLLKKGSSNKKNNSSDKSPRGSMLDETAKKSQQRSDEFNEDLDNEVLSDDDFENELEEATDVDYETDDQDESDDENVNVIEIDIEQSKDIDLDSSLIDEDEIPDNTKEKDQTADKDNDLEEDHEEHTNIVQGNVRVDYSEEDIKFETEYTYEHREELYHTYVKAIKYGGMEIATSKVLQLHDIVRISVTLTELKEQVGCEARVISVFPQSIRSSEADNKYRYIVQFIGPNASETERVLSKYLLGYKVK